MTLAPGTRLGPLPVDEALDVGRQVATALEAAHEGGVVHRDLKPGNVMLTPPESPKTSAESGIRPTRLAERATTAKWTSSVAAG